MKPLFALGLIALTASPATAEMSARGNYILRCTGCHGIEGMGTAEGGVPPFPGSVGHIANTEAGRDYMMHVPGVIASSLTDSEIASVMNYVMATFDTTDAPEFTTEEVTRRRAVPMTDIVVARRAVVQELETKGIQHRRLPLAISHSHQNALGPPDHSGGPFQFCARLTDRRSGRLWFQGILRSLPARPRGQDPRI